MADRIDGNRPPEPIPPALSLGLDLFAATWLQRWTDAGGYVAIGRDGKASAGFVPYEDSPHFRAPDYSLPDEIQRADAACRDGHYHGSMRALLGLLAAMPTGWQAVEAHLLAHGMTEMVGARQL